MSTLDQIDADNLDLHLSRSADRQPRRKSKEALSNACTLSSGTNMRLSVKPASIVNVSLYHESLAQGIEPLFKRCIVINRFLIAERIPILFLSLLG